jgi:hypothetical protein
MKTLETLVYAKKACSIVLAVALCPLLTLAETIAPEAGGTSAELETHSVARPLPVNARLPKEARLNAPVRSDQTQRDVLSRPPIANPADSRKASRKKMLFTGLALMAGGAAMNALSYGSEPYTYVYCGTCRPVMSTTLYRDTTSSSLYWGGIAVAGGGATMFVFSLFKKK